MRFDQQSNTYREKDDTGELCRTPNFVTTIIAGDEGIPDDEYYLERLRSWPVTPPQNRARHYR